MLPHSTVISFSQLQKQKGLILKENSRAVTYEPVDKDPLREVAQLFGRQRHPDLIVPSRVQQLQRLALLVEGVACKSLKKLPHMK
jgi:hypothetical protein